MQLAKPSEADIHGVNQLAHLIDHIFDNRNGLYSASVNWMTKEEIAEWLDRDDPPDWPTCIIHRDPDTVRHSEGIEADRAYDIEATMSQAYNRFGAGMFRVAWGIGPLIESACDPHLDHYALSPAILTALNQRHPAPEHL